MTLLDSDFVPVLGAQQPFLGADVGFSLHGPDPGRGHLGQVDVPLEEGDGHRRLILELLQIDVVDRGWTGMGPHRVVVRILEQMKGLRGLILVFGVDPGVRDERARPDRVRVRIRVLRLLRRNPLPLGFLDDRHEHRLPGDERSVEVDRHVPGGIAEGTAALLRILPAALHDSIHVRFECPEVEDALTVVVYREHDIVDGERRAVVPCDPLSDLIRPVHADGVTRRAQGQIGNIISVFVEGKQIIINESVQQIRWIVQSLKWIQAVDRFEEADL